MRCKTLKKYGRNLQISVVNFSSSNMPKSVSFLVFFFIFSNAVEATTNICKPNGFLKGTAGNCNTMNDSECCENGKKYNTYVCSPTVTSKTPATLTLNGFGKGDDGGGAGACFGKFYRSNELVVALSTGWMTDYSNSIKTGKSRCGKRIRISAGGKSVLATVVDECSSVSGCDREHSYQPPCSPNVVDASNAVWKLLGIKENSSKYGYMNVTWKDV